MKQLLLGVFILSSFLATSVQACRYDPSEEKKGNFKIQTETYKGILSCKTYFDADKKPVKTVWYIGKMPLKDAPSAALQKMKGKEITLKGIVRKFGCVTCAPHETKISHGTMALIIIPDHMAKDDDRRF